ncbi:MAG: tryptophan--tRNA ligase [Verrucomicrobia bacterium]|nr:tryptophan--tRNA ligase [Verrucomicrobiota bacterium]
MRYLSGIQPTGRLHLGNYFGMIRPAVELQAKGDAYYFLADYHALTGASEVGLLDGLVKETFLDLLACGVDPERAVVFRQSAVPEVHELAWYLSTVTPMGLLERCHSYKDKVAKGISPSHGLFAYPVLMAADILLYDADRVPVGQDQKQHLEVARDIAGKFNERYGQVFKLPESVIREDAGVVPGVDGQKMSKSYGNTLEIFAPEKELHKKIMGIKTDSTPVEAPKVVEGSILWGLARLVGSEGERAEYRRRMEQGGSGYGDLKKSLADLVLKEFEGMRKKREELVADPKRVEMWMRDGGAKARKTAEEVLKRVRAAVGTRE